ncbi:MAG TPA: AraC family transcriptional regulator [Blastocatellia bacterium]|jgi:AraC-like DNA-binding protein|nr:AraC family transcriptional regulator [Blastocatellia bacterium]
MDALTEILNSVRVRSTIYCPIEIGAPWGLHIEEEIGAPFFILVKGVAFLVIKELNIRQYLKAGDFIIITKRCACEVSDSPQSEIIDLQEWLRRNPPRPDGTFEVEGKGEITKFIGGTFFFENHESHPLLKVLPPFLHFSVTSEKGGNDSKMVDQFRATLDLITGELASRKPGAGPIVSRFSDILFIKAVRSYAITASGKGGNGGETPNWFTAAMDPQISEAIANIHREPQTQWTVERLANLSGMSRSAFASRFSELVGEPPLRYLSRWRMHKAIEMLREGRRTTSEIASLVGYESEAAFSKAFKKWNGQGPGSYRRSSAPG